MSARTKANLALLISAVIWGASTPIIKYTLAYTTPYQYLYYRFLITSVVLFPFLAKYLRKKLTHTKDLLGYLILGFISAPLNLALYFYGLDKTTATDAAIINIFSPLIVVIGGALLLNETVNKREKVGIAITFLGTVLTIIQPVFEHGIVGNKGNLVGNLLVFLAALPGAAFYFLYKTKRYRHLDPLLLVFFSFFIGIFVFLPVVFLSPEGFAVASAAWPGIVYMAVFGSAIAFFTHTYGLSKIEASEATLFSYLQPVIAIPLSVIFLKDTVTIPLVVGLIFVIIGVFASETRKQIINTKH